MSDTNSYTAFLDKLKNDPKEAKKFLRAVMGPPYRTLEGKERDDILLLLSMTEPFKESNNQHSWTSYYMIGKTEYHVTVFSEYSESVVDEMLPEDDL
jgi:hypothetical protein